MTAHPRLRGAALTIAEPYALQHHPDLQERLSAAVDATGEERIGYSHIQPRTRDDLTRRREMIKLWARIGDFLQRAREWDTRPG